MPIFNFVSAKRKTNSAGSYVDPPVPQCATEFVPQELHGLYDADMKQV